MKERKEKRKQEKKKGRREKTPNKLLLFPPLYMKKGKNPYIMGWSNNLLKEQSRNKTSTKKNRKIIQKREGIFPKNIVYHHEQK